MIYLIYYKIPKTLFTLTPGFSYLRDQHRLDFSNKYNIWIGLYGWTRKKSVVKKFKSTRNMQYFKIKEVDITMDEFESQLEDKKLKNRLKISIYPMSTIIDDNECVIEFPLTNEEYSLCCSGSSGTDNATFAEMVMDCLDTSMFVNPGKFSEKIRCALEMLGFIDLYCIASEDQLSDIPEVVDLHSSISEIVAYNASFGVGLYIQPKLSMKFGMFEIYSLLFGGLLVEV